MLINNNIMSINNDNVSINNDRCMVNHKIKMVYINLDRRPDRKEKVEKEFNRFRLSVDRFPAIDGSQLKMTENLIEMFKNNKFGWRRGVIGALLSHYTLWEELSMSEYDYYLIFEDDIELSDNFIESYYKTQIILSKNKINLLFLGYHTDGLYKNKPTIYNMDDSMYVYRLLNEKDVWGGLFGYMIHKDLATRLVNIIKKEGISEPIDMFLVKNAVLHSVHPFMVNSPFMTFENRVDSDIQNDMLKVDDEYDFYTESDSYGNDIRWSPVKTYDELRKEADNDPDCVAFNTYSFLKHTITTPDKFIKLPSCNSKLHGLYVKRNHPKNKAYRDFLNI
jgi:GR25 family glycosyltransferase involved in LPS biosynthesis